MVASRIANNKSDIASNSSAFCTHNCQRRRISAILTIKVSAVHQHLITYFGEIPNQSISFTYISG